MKRPTLFDDPDFTFWRDWYRGFLNGRPLDWELQKEIALIPDEEWEKGPGRIAELIEEIRPRFVVKARTADLETELVTATRDRFGIGGNNPPEEIGAATPVAKELLIVWAPLQDIKAETESETPDKSKLKNAITALGKALKAGVKWCASKADLAVDTMIKWGIPAAGGSYLALNPDKITAVMEAAQHWLAVLP